tara:strand:- start:217 stop:363 length:147 start_codon:yes stop_codon:yes gene_type:complete
MRQKAIDYLANPNPSLKRELTSEELRWVQSQKGGKKAEAPKPPKAKGK